MIERQTGLQQMGVQQCMLSHSVVSLCDLMDGSPPGFSVHGTFQARILEWGAIAFSANGIHRFPNTVIIWYLLKIVFSCV